MLKKKTWHHMPINLGWRLAAAETVKLAGCTLADFWIVGKQSIHQHSTGHKAPAPDQAGMAWIKC